MFDIGKERVDILAAALEQREREVLHYQINIDNYQLALSEIEEKHANSEAMADFANQLRGLLAASIIEQAKETIMRDVVAKQLDALA